MTRPDVELLVGWELLSYSKQMKLQKLLKRIPNYQSRLNIHDVLKLKSVRKRKKYTVYVEKVYSIRDEKVYSIRDAKIIKRRNCLRMPKPDLTKLDSFIKQEGSNSEKANKAWQLAVENIIYCKIADSLIEDRLSTKEPNQREKLYVCESLSLRSHTKFAASMELAWQNYCTWKRREKAEIAQLNQYIQMTKFALTSAQQMSDQEGVAFIVSELCLYIPTREALIQECQDKQAEYKKQLKKQTRKLKEHLFCV